MATVLGSLQASSNTDESEGRQMKQCQITYIKKRKNPPLKERDGCVLLRRIGQALLARGLLSHASSAPNRKGGLRAAQRSRPGTSGRGSQKPHQQCTEQKERVDEI
jgi:hypothetical protein